MPEPRRTDGGGTERADLVISVKEEKLPQHCACDHHIELGGLLPPEALSQLQILKEAFTTAPIISHFHPSLPTIVEIDTSNYALGAVMCRLANLPAALSCWNDVYPDRGVDFISKNPQSFHQVIKQDGIYEPRFFSIKAEMFSDVVEQTQKKVWKDKEYKEILKQLERGESVSNYSLEPQSKFLLFKDRVVIPRNPEILLEILQKHHE
ncbi:hypothetical protein O181_037853 [Austropuccinia psidii MF-1]|uniref:Reverse transcriptase/retrotransposon-derived protein RNase H-like domain-containing protein n=1 Tax=Austropuccinia psidii MF-1 TaxID=1389203 RepID=A0A9Q3DAB2_9BASI|nr:hypothetical protein [Austropuccinia psidii MF-1]